MARPRAAKCPRLLRLSRNRDNEGPSVDTDLEEAMGTNEVRRLFIVVWSSIALLILKCLVLRGHSSTARTEDLPRPITEASEGPQYLNSQNRGLPVEAASNPNLGLQRLDNDSEVAHGASGSPNLGHAPHRLESLDQFSPLVGSPYYLGLIADIVGSPSLDHHNDLFELQLSGVGQLCPANSRPRCGWVKPSPSNELISRILKGTVDHASKILI